MELIPVEQEAESTRSVQLIENWYKAGLSKRPTINAVSDQKYHFSKTS